MGWAIGHDDDWDRWIGYGVPAYCDHPECDAKIDRGLSYVCCSEQPYGGRQGCGLYFCDKHRVNLKGQCARCAAKQEPFDPKSEHPAWLKHILYDPSWGLWRAENVWKVAEYQQLLSSYAAK